jgi:hypothetical protein
MKTVKRMKVRGQETKREAGRENWIGFEWMAYGDSTRR